jgi:hypothetical protein
VHDSARRQRRLQEGRMYDERQDLIACYRSMPVIPGGLVQGISAEAAASRRADAEWSSVPTSGVNRSP